MAVRAMLLMGDAPHAGMRFRERLDLMLMTLAFELEVTAVFTGSGVLQLLAPGKQPDALHDHGAALGSLPLYGINAIYAEAEALQHFGIEAGQLRIAVTVCGADELSALMHRQDLLL